MAKMARQLGMKFIGHNPKEQRVSVEYRGKGITYPVEEFVAHYHSSQPSV